MSKLLAVLATVFLFGMVLLAPRQSSAAQSGADTNAVQATMAATEPVIQVKDGVTLDSNYFETDTASPKLSIKLREPVLVGKPSPAVTGFNKAADDIVQSISKMFKADYGQLEAGATLPPEIATLGSFVDATYQVIEADPALISIKFNVAWYGAGAAHPNTYSVTLNYNLNAGKVLTLADLFKPNTNYLQAISDYSIKTLQAAGKLDFPEGAQPKPENYQSWNIRKDGLQINFDDYQVTPHAVGPQTVIIPYSALTSLINPKGPLAQFIG